MSPSIIDLVLNEGSIIDNKKTLNSKQITLKDILILIAEESVGLKCAVGYFYIEGFSLIIDSLKELKDIKILMGFQTTKLTKEELIKAFRDKLNTLEVTRERISSIALFHHLVKQSKNLEIRVYYGEGEKIQKLHSKCYLFIKNPDNPSALGKYTAGIIGSSNLTPSGLIGNTELNVIITERNDLIYLDKWFDDLWEKGSDRFEDLKVSDIISRAIEDSKFSNEIKQEFLQVSPKEFFTMLIKMKNAYYLFENWKESKLLGFQQIDVLRCFTLINEKNYRGIFLTTSVGLGKSYVASQIASNFIRDQKKVLLIAPSGLVDNEEQWPRYLNEFKLTGQIDILKMGILQKDPTYFNNIVLKLFEKQYSLIIVDEAHNYRNKDAYRTRNLKTIFDKNGDSKIIFLTATPINTNLEDLLSLIQLFYRKGLDIHFDKIYRDLSEIVSILSRKSYDDLTEEDKIKISSNQENIEKELFVKSTRATIKTSPEYIEQITRFTGVDITKIPDPKIIEGKYSLDKKYKEFVNGIVDFLNSLTAANLRLMDPTKGSRLSGFFKWILYKRFESGITAYYLTLKRIHHRNTLILKAIEKKDPSILDNIESEEDYEINFDLDYRQKLSYIISILQAGKGNEYIDILKDLDNDSYLINKEIKKLEKFLVPKNNLLFIDDKKLSKLLDFVISEYMEKKILMFTQYKDTLKTIQEFFRNRFENGAVEYVDASTSNKLKLIKKFNDDNNLRILITTDTLSEGYNISGADIIINFDIPYNPVRLIQRIGRATRLDNPKHIKVINFRPSKDIDKELLLVERLKIRIEDIIRFVGIEYRIWFQRETKLLKERRHKDIKLYHEILDGIRKDIWKGNFDNLEVNLPYTNSILILMKNAISKYSITKDEINKQKIDINAFTLLEGKKHLTIFYDGSKSYNDNNNYDKINELSDKIDFRRLFHDELKNFHQYRKKEKQEERILSYYNDRTDKSIRNIIEFITKNGYDQIYESSTDLIKQLNSVKDKCGNQTEKLIFHLNKEIRRDSLNNNFFNNYAKKLEDSFSKRTIQTKIINEENPYLALVFLEK